MVRKNCFYKISGDLLFTKELSSWLLENLGDDHNVVCIGGGSPIGDALKENGFKRGNFCPLGRQTDTLEERQIARDVLEKLQAEFQDFLYERGIKNVNVIIPVLEIATVLCHVNGDEMIRMAYLGYDKLYVLTKEERVVKKQKFFQDLPKVEIIGL